VQTKEDYVPEADVSRGLAAQAGMEWMDLSTKVIPPEVINQIRGEDARRFKVIPVGLGETGLIVAVGDPLDIDTIDSLGFYRHAPRVSGDHASTVTVHLLRRACVPACCCRL
jgi:hypothetical protein